MNEKNINIICDGDIDSVLPILDGLLQRNANSFVFPELDNGDLRLQLWCGLFDRLQNPTASKIHQLCLANIRILSRDKTHLNNMMCDKWVNTLLELTGLYQLTVADDEQLPTQIPTDAVMIESLKCLCNLIFNSITVQDISARSCMAEGIICRLKTYKDGNVHTEIKYYDMRLLHMLTALRADVRSTIKNEYHGSAYLIECLNEILKEADNLNCASTNPSFDNAVILDDTQVDLSCEILKVLFNLSLTNKNLLPAEEQEDVHTLRLVSTCSSLLLCKTTESKKYTLHNNIVNLLTSMPPSCYLELTPLVKNDVISNKSFEYDGRNMEALQCLIEFLQYKLTNTQNVGEQNDNLTPILGVMYKAAGSSNFLRKYLRSIVLPPLKDVHTRPEEGNTLRNQLCRLLTTPVTRVRDLAGHFLFILCKENVGRMIKYTGYGNAAGLFASRGLLGTASSQYSSDSEDSDTEEYIPMRHTVNPVTGCYEPPRIDPMAGCTEEQKEYEAMKLVNLMDQLNRAGIVQPCRIGPDGRPEPVEHVLQLQEDLPNQQVQKR